MGCILRAVRSIDGADAAVISFLCVPPTNSVKLLGFAGLSNKKPAHRGFLNNVYDKRQNPVNLRGATSWRGR